MIDQHSTAAGALAGAATSTASLFMGAQVDALVLGLISAVFVSIWLEKIDNRLKAAAAVLMSSLLAGYGSPVAAEWVIGNSSNVYANLEALRLLLAVVIGGGAPLLVPIGIKYFGNKISGGQS